MLQLVDRRNSRALVPPSRPGNRYVLFEDIPTFWDAWDLEVSHLDKGWDAGTDDDGVEAAGVLGAAGGGVRGADGLVSSAAVGAVLGADRGIPGAAGGICGPAVGIHSAACGTPVGCGTALGPPPCIPCGSSDSSAAAANTADGRGGGAAPAAVEVLEGGPLRARVRFRARIGASSLMEQTISLDALSARCGGCGVWGLVWRSFGSVFLLWWEVGGLLWCGVWGVGAGLEVVRQWFLLWWGDLGAALSGEQRVASGVGARERHTARAKRGEGHAAFAAAIATALTGGRFAMTATPPVVLMHWNGAPSTARGQAITSSTQATHSPFGLLC
eukprot:366529-Chlamydomonas_euryale.AAC.19